jgi:transcription antitermination factor NusA-like protein
MITQAELDNVANQLESKLGVPRQETIEFFKGAMIRAYKAAYPNNQDNLAVEFHANQWQLVSRNGGNVQLISDKQTTDTIKHALIMIQPYIDQQAAQQPKPQPQPTPQPKPQTEKPQPKPEPPKPPEKTQQEKNQIALAAFQKMKTMTLNATVVGKTDDRLILRIDNIPGIGTQEAAILFSGPDPQARNYNVGQVFSVWPMRTQLESYGAQTIIVTCNSANVVEQAFRNHVAQIQSGKIEIKKVARISGVATRIAVWSDLDPIGPCIGKGGATITKIKNELGDPNVSVVQWYPDIEAFIGSALDVKCKSIVYDQNTKVATVVVYNQDLARANGTNGANKNIAKALTGVQDIIIQSTSEAPPKQPKVNK